MRMIKTILVSFMLLGLVVQPAVAISTVRSEIVVSATVYRLVEGSTLVVLPTTADDTALPVVALPITGKFLLYPVPGPGPAGTRHFKVKELEFRPVGDPNHYWGHNGEGEYILSDGSNEPQWHEMWLQIAIDRCGPLYFKSDRVPVPENAQFPWIDIKLAQTESTVCRFALRLVAVPWPDLWFSTEVPFTSGSLGGRRISDGDLLSAAGQVVRVNRQLLERFRPLNGDAGLDTVMGPPSSDGTAPAIEIGFSTEVDVRTNSPYRVLKQGDLLSDAGRVVRRNEELIRPFAPMPPIRDLGLDAVAADLRTSAPSNALLFSTEESFFSECLGVWVSHGDLLREGGTIFRTNEELLSKFHPLAVPTDGFGLDAVYVWPHGEIWFSTEVDFRDQVWGLIRHGDLLSDRGRVVVRNHDLMAPFDPLEDLADFGLDAGWLVPFADSGTLIRGVECILFRADHGGLYVLENYKDFGVGDRVWVSGILDPDCVTTCMQGDGCIRYNVITKAP